MIRHCIQNVSASEDTHMLPATKMSASGITGMSTELGVTRTGVIERHEIAAYAKTAERGDVLPACMRLVAARADAAWSDRTSMAMVVGPACRGEVLDMACMFMPRAAEPRLLRAALAMSNASRANCSHQRDSWLAAARRDLDDASQLDPNDLSARVLLAELVRCSAYAFSPPRACVAAA